MRLLLDGRALQPELDGIGRCASAVSTRVARARPDWDVTLLVSQGSGADLARAPGLHLEASAVPRFLPGEASRLGSAVARIAPGLYYSFSMGGPSWRGLRSVFMIHDLMVLELPGYFGPSGLRNALYRAWFGRILRRTARTATAIVAPSHWVRERICSRFPEAAGRVRVIHNGQDLFDCSEPGAPRKGDFLLYVGNSRAYKNLDRLISAYSAALREADLPRLVMVVRRDRAFPSLVRTIGRAGLENRIELLAGLSESELKARYSDCLAFLSPSVSEGFGLPVLEAMAAGCPVLASRGTALEEVAGDGALLVDPLDAAAIARGILELATDSDMRDELSLKARARASLFSWEGSAAQVVSLVEEVAG